MAARLEDGILADLDQSWVTVEAEDSPTRWCDVLRGPGRRAENVDDRAADGLDTGEPIGEQSFFEGRLSGITGGKVRLELEGKNARIVEVPLEAIRKANLVVEW